MNSFKELFIGPLSFAESGKIQKILLDNGVRRSDGTVGVRYTNKPFLVINNKNEFCHSTTDDPNRLNLWVWDCRKLTYEQFMLFTYELEIRKELNLEVDNY